MIGLRFQLDDDVLEHDAKHDPGTADPAALQETYFVLPTRFEVDDVDLLGAEGVTVAPWLPLPILHVARVFADLVDGLNDEASATYHLPGGGWQLQLKRRGTGVSVHSTVNGTSVEVSYAELRSAADSFRKDVCSLLISRAPELAHHADWGAWVSESRR